MSKTRVLFVCEATTMAHVGRILSLASFLDDKEYDTLLACGQEFHGALGKIGQRVTAIETISSAHFLRALRLGKNPYDLETLERYVKDELRVMDEFQPDIVVGDFRFSLLASTKLRNVPYVNMVNAYWSPFARPRWQLPSHPIYRLLGPAIMEPLFKLLRPLFFKRFTRELNKFLSAYGLPRAESDFRTLYSAGDYVIHPDMEEMVPTFNRPLRHTYLGPLTWSPRMDLPHWWEKIARGQAEPVVFLSLGSSGDGAHLKNTVAALAGLPVKVLLATAGRSKLGPLPDNFFVSDMIPLEDVVKVADLVVCNGGSGTLNHCMKAGIPVLGIVDIMDQYLSMGYAEKAGAGLLLRGDSATETAVRTAIMDLLGNAAFKRRALRLQQSAKRYDPARTFRNLIQRIAWDRLPPRGVPTTPVPASEAIAA